MIQDAQEPFGTGSANENTLKAIEWLVTQVAVMSEAHYHKEDSTLDNVEKLNWLLGLQLQKIYDVTKVKETIPNVGG